MPKNVKLAAAAALMVCSSFGGATVAEAASWTDQLTLTCIKNGKTTVTAKSVAIRSANFTWYDQRGQVNQARAASDIATHRTIVVDTPSSARRVHAKIRYPDSDFYVIYSATCT